MACGTDYCSQFSWLRPIPPLTHPKETARDHIVRWRFQDPLLAIGRSIRGTMYVFMSCHRNRTADTTNSLAHKAIHVMTTHPHHPKIGSGFPGSDQRIWRVSSPLCLFCSNLVWLLCFVASRPVCLVLWDRTRCLSHLLSRLDIV